MPEPQVGDRRTLVRTFSPEEVRAFAELSGDKGVHHLQANATGNLIVHGLLLATIPTQAGGELNFLAREFNFEFLRPAFTRVPISCELTITRWEPAPKGHLLESSWECCDPEGKVLMRGSVRGLVPSPGASQRT